MVIASQYYDDDEEMSSPTKAGNEGVKAGSPTTDANPRRLSLSSGNDGKVSEKMAGSIMGVYPFRVVNFSVD